VRVRVFVCMFVRVSQCGKEPLQSITDQEFVTQEVCACVCMCMYVCVCVCACMCIYLCVHYIRVTVWQRAAAKYYISRVRDVGCVCVCVCVCVIVCHSAAKGRGKVLHMKSS